jgi:hypothetical protein
MPKFYVKILHNYSDNSNLCKTFYISFNKLQTAYNFIGEIEQRFLEKYELSNVEDEFIPFSIAILCSNQSNQSNLNNILCFEKLRDAIEFYEFFLSDESIAEIKYENINVMQNIMIEIINRITIERERIIFEENVQEVLRILDSYNVNDLDNDSYDKIRGVFKECAKKLNIEADYSV